MCRVEFSQKVRNSKRGPDHCRDSKTLELWLIKLIPLLSQGTSLAGQRRWLASGGDCSLVLDSSYPATALTHIMAEQTDAAKRAAARKAKILARGNSGLNKLAQTARGDEAAALYGDGA